ncbi:DUF3861 domain-containing protein [Pseudomonas sp. B2M1-30]|uniref:DUF3861 domain-containing protein n=1 Tax=Pseudomonas TaxID=286 RepID=UPI0021C7AC04|nr:MULTISPECIES: DUF3861 domain-containing protein [Pseudomonas]MCU0119962.1 DUF3861 domain-containing protein [Pseudomonas sp. B2M1-30]MCU7261973.1 DUF3861 domain-containing protein [Pseudomonas koreensis]
MTEKNMHHYRVTIESLDETQNGGSSMPVLAFDVRHHDDILGIAERVRSGTAFSVSDANSLAVGLKLFTGVMLAHRQDPLFSGIQPAMRAFIGNLKSRISATTSAKQQGQ